MFARSLALAAFLMLAGCAASVPDALAPGLRAELPRPALALLEETARAVEARDWDAYRATLNPEGFGEAVGFRVGGGGDRTAAISETLESALGLGWVSTRVFPEGADRVEAPTAGLARIATLRFDAVTDRRPQAAQLSVSGQVTLDDGTTLPVSVTVLRPSGPDPVLAVPQG